MAVYSIPLCRQTSEPLSSILPLKLKTQSIGGGEDTENGGNPQSANMQFEYAWRWFDLHAKQRVSMFNFFLISVGALATAYGLLLREQLYVVAAVAAFMGVFVSLVSCLLDVRNHELVKMGEEALQGVERAHLTECQILTDEKQPSSLLKHGWLIRSLEIVVAIVYLAGVVYSVILALECLT